MLRSKTLRPLPLTASRRRFLVWGAFGAAAAFAPGLAGCSGGTKHGEPDSTFAGSYRAAYTIPSANENGTFAYSVARSGDIIGSFVDGSTNATKAFSGHLHNDGNFAGTTTDGINSYPTSGTVSAVVSSATGGNFNQMRGGVMYPGSFSFVTTGVTAPTDSQFAGAYSGSFGLSGQIPGPASYSIDKQGGVTGFVTTNGETGTLRGQVGNTGAFIGVVTYPSGQATVTGTLATTTTAGQPAGNVVQTKGGVSTPGSFGAPIALPADSKFVGSYQGTYGVQDNDEAGDMTFTVDASGTVNGSINLNQSTNQNNQLGDPAGSVSRVGAGDLKGVMASDGNFFGTITYQVAPTATTAGIPTTTSRTIKGKMASGTVNSVVKLQGDYNIQYVNTGQSVGPNLTGVFDVALTFPKNVDSIFRGAFASGNVPGFNIAANPVLPPSSDLTFTVDKEGKMIGSVGNFQINGTFANDGRVVGSIFSDTASYPFTGKLSLQKVTVEIDPLTGKGTPTDGVAGNIVVTINGTTYPATVQGAGGFTIK